MSLRKDIWRKLQLGWYRRFPPRRLTIAGFSFDVSDPAISPAIRWYMVQQAVLGYGYEDDEIMMLNKSLEPGDRVVELGCGVGVTSVIACDRVGSANYRGYEANPQLTALISRNLRTNGFDGEVRQAAVVPGDESTVTFHVASEFWSSSLVRRTDVSESRELTVPAEKLATILEEFHPNTLVIDIEGGELSLLEAVDLPGVTKLFLELHPHVIGENECQRLLEKFTSQGWQLESGRIVRDVKFLSRESA